MSETPLDALSSAGLVDEILRGQDHVLGAVRAARVRLVAAVDLMTSTYQAGGRIILVGAGTSGRLAMMEAAEVSGTFGIPTSRIAARLAGAGVDQPFGTDTAEDDEELGRADVDSLGVGPQDVVVAVAASGTTPYTFAAAEASRRAGAALITVTTVDRSPLAALADVAIEVPTGPEVVSGSTRLAAGTAQKLVLNTMTTASMARSGHVHGRFMVDIVPANTKLMQRAAGIVAASCGVPDEVALTVLHECGDDVRTAIVHLVTGLLPAEAASLAAAHRTVREALESADESRPPWPRVTGRPAPGPG